MDVRFNRYGPEPIFRTGFFKIGFLTNFWAPGWVSIDWPWNFMQVHLIFNDFSWTFWILWFSALGRSSLKTFSWSFHVKVLSQDLPGRHRLPRKVAQLLKWLFYSVLDRIQFEIFEDRTMDLFCHFTLSIGAGIPIFMGQNLILTHDHGYARPDW